MALNNARIIDLPKICDTRGNLSFIQNLDQLPFEIARVYWIYDVPGGHNRDGHAFRSQHEFIVALSGSFDIILKNDSEKKTFHMSRSYYGLYVPALTWRELDNFSTNSVALVLSSTTFDENDYIRDFDMYKTILKNGK